MTSDDLFPLDANDMHVAHIAQPFKVCAIRKQTHLTIPKGQAYKAIAPFELIHGDLVGPIQTSSYVGNLYFFLSADDFLRYNWVYFIQCKSEALQKFLVFKITFEKQYSSLV